MKRLVSTVAVVLMVMLTGPSVSAQPIPQDCALRTAQCAANYTPEQIAAIKAWNAAVLKAQIEAWNIEMWNQAVVTIDFPGLGGPCREMVLAMVRNGANRWELSHWLAIGRRESLCLLWVVNNRPPDFSVCWFQINYYGSLYNDRVREFGTPELLTRSEDACARAGLGLKARAGWGPWGG